MVETIAARKVPVYRKAWLAFATSLVALVLAWYGSLHAEKHLPESPLRKARGLVAISESGPWYDKLFNKAEGTIFGSSLDQKIHSLTDRSKAARYTIEVIAFGLPFVLGIAACLLGGSALKGIEKSNGAYCGNFQSIFSILIGGFASVIAGCMSLSIFLWPIMPSLYTR